MHKTTLYLDGPELRKLRALAVRRPGRSTSDLVRLAIRDFLGRQKKAAHQSFLRKVLARKSSRTAFGDPVSYQRKIRSEWR